jgi:hypothetical protein
VPTPAMFGIVDTDTDTDTDADTDADMNGASDAVNTKGKRKREEDEARRLLVSLIPHARIEEHLTKWGDVLWVPAETALQTLAQRRFSAFLVLSRPRPCFKTNCSTCGILVAWPPCCVPSQPSSSSGWEADGSPRRSHRRVRGAHALDRGDAERMQNQRDMATTLGRHFQAVKNNAIFLSFRLHFSLPSAFVVFCLSQKLPRARSGPNTHCQQPSRSRLQARCEAGSQAPPPASPETRRYARRENGTRGQNRSYPAIKLGRRLGLRSFISCRNS